jgi:hypothetical protein
VVKNSYKNTEAISAHLFQRGHGSIDESTNIPRQLILHIHEIVHWIHQFFAASGSTGAAIDQSGGGGGHLLPQLQNRPQLFVWHNKTRLKSKIKISQKKGGKKRGKKKEQIAQDQAKSMYEGSTCALHRSLSYLAASRSLEDSTRSCLIRAAELVRWRLRSMLSGKQNTYGASVSGSYRTN